MSIPNQRPIEASPLDYPDDFQIPCAKEEMIGWVRSQDIKALKESLNYANQTKLFKTILSENIFSTEELNKLLKSAVEYNQKKIEEISSEDNWGSIDPDAFADRLLKKLIELLIKHHQFAPEVLGAALISCSKLGRCDLISCILNTRKILPEHIEAAFLKGIDSGWLEVVDLFLSDLSSKKFPDSLWIEALQLSFEWGAHGIARSLVKAIGDKSRLDEIKSQCTEQPELILFIDEIVKEIQNTQEFHKAKLKVKHTSSFDLTEPQTKRRKYDSSSE